MNLGQKILVGIGSIGLLLLIPVISYTFGYTIPVDWLEHHLGTLGSPSVLTFIAFCLIGTMAFLGGGKNFSATLLSLPIAGFFIATAVEIDSLNWLKEGVSSIAFLSNLKLNLIVGIGVLLLGVLLSFVEKVSFKVEALLLTILPLAFLIGSHQAGILSDKPDFNISMTKGLQSLRGMIDVKYLEQENVQQYVEEVAEDKTLTEEERLQKMQALQDKIQKMEREQELLKGLKSENEKYKKLLAEQAEQLEEYKWCAGSRDTSVQVQTYAEAVVPNQPCVRDFAVSLVKEKEGAYYDHSRGFPGKQGLEQLCILHYYLANHWKYISDPTMIVRDYNSPANRTIALGLAGDCDDFAILNASCVEAIGGISRIMIGTCSGGGHAWAEVLIGKSEEDWTRATQVIRDYYKDSSKKLEPHIDERGYYWLSLDWYMGQFTCNDNPSDLTTRYTSREQLIKGWKSL